MRPITTPGFLLTRKLPIPLQRKLTGGWNQSTGKWEDGVIENITIQANVQPLKQYEILQMKESDRTKGWVKLYTVDEVRQGEQGENGFTGDVITWQGFQWEIRYVDNHKMGVLDHYKAKACRVETTLEE